MIVNPQLNSTANRIISFLNNCNCLHHIHQIQAQIILHYLHFNTTVASHFITSCQSLNHLNTAYRLINQLHRPHVFTCNSLIKAFSHSQIPHIPFSIYTRMHSNSILPNNYTFPFLLKSLSDFKGIQQGRIVHAHVVKLGHGNDIYVQNSLLNVYASCGNMRLCRKVFEEMTQRDVVSWTVMIMGYRSAKKYDDALIAFEQMQYAGVEPNRVTMVNALAACASFGAIEMGIWIHDFIRKKKWELDVILGTALIDIGLALVKSGEEAVMWFDQMVQEGIKADEVTLVEVLSACSHSGLLDIGQVIFRSLMSGNPAAIISRLRSVLPSNYLITSNLPPVITCKSFASNRLMDKRGLENKEFVVFVESDKQGMVMNHKHKFHNLCFHLSKHSIRYLFTITEKQMQE
ncbi:hypothetical protein QYF36_003619 [Acer negundo]|nr:hypothetical protein QYF36_003619 [Acer negundo]